MVLGNFILPHWKSLWIPFFQVSNFILQSTKEIDKHIESLRAFSDIMVKQQERIVHLEKENMELKEQIQNLNAQLNQQHEQSQYHKHENEQDFGMYL